MVMTSMLQTCQVCKGTGRRLIQAQTKAQRRKADPPPCELCLGAGRVPRLSIRPTHPTEQRQTRL